MVVPALLACSAESSVVYVRASATGLGNGTSWANAYSNLQQALLAAIEGDEIWVAAGTYAPAPAGGSREASFDISMNVTLLGGFAGIEGSASQRDPALNITVLSGDLNGDDEPGFINRGDNSFQVVVILAGRPTIDGFTITAGYASGPGFGATPASMDQGAGANVYDAEPTFSRCIFRDNWALNHGALNDHGSSVLIDCAFIENHAVGFGAGLYIHHHSLTRATNCRFIRNTTPGDGAGIYCRGLHVSVIENCEVLGNEATRGAGMYVAEDASPRVESCMFTGNSALLGGGGIYADKAFGEIVSCRFERNHAGESRSGGGGGGGGSGGGGVWVTRGAPMIVSCEFIENRASFGGGFYAIEECRAEVTGCEFTDNSATEAGGLYTLSSPVLVRDCTFVGNRAFGSDFSVGGGLSSYFSNARVERCRFARNEAELGGGGVYAEGESPVVMNSIFLGNRTTGHEQGWGGGVLNGYHTHATIAGCAFIGNQADEGGGAYTMVLADPSFVNCTFVSNAATATGASAGGLYCSEFAAVRVTNCIVWGNSGSQIHGAERVDYSCVEGGMAGDGNTGMSPMLSRLPHAGVDGEWGTVDDDAGDLRPGPGSPCIDSGDNSAILAGFVEDLSGGMRRRDDPSTVDSGMGAAPIIDMGAYEFVARCMADLDDGSGTGAPDGGVTIDDLLFYLLAFESGSGDADVDDGTFTGMPDGGVTIDDLLYFLARFDAGC